MCQSVTYLLTDRWHILTVLGKLRNYATSALRLSYFHPNSQPPTLKTTVFERAEHAERELQCLNWNIWGALPVSVPWEDLRWKINMCQNILYVNTLFSVNIWESWLHHTFSKSLCSLNLIKHAWCVDMSHLPLYIRDSTDSYNASTLKVFETLTMIFNVA